MVSSGILLRRSVVIIATSSNLIFQRTLIYHLRWSKYCRNIWSISVAQACHTVHHWFFFFEQIFKSAVKIPVTGGVLTLTMMILNSTAANGNGTCLRLIWKTFQRLLRMCKCSYNSGHCFRLCIPKWKEMKLDVILGNYFYFCKCSWFIHNSKNIVALEKTQKKFNIM